MVFWQTQKSSHSVKSIGYMFTGEHWMQEVDFRMVRIQTIKNWYWLVWSLLPERALWYSFFRLRCHLRLVQRICMHLKLSIFIQHLFGLSKVSFIWQTTNVGSKGNYNLIIWQVRLVKEQSYFLVSLNSEFSCTLLNMPVEKANNFFCLPEIILDC